MNSVKIVNGGMAEWFKAAVLKTVEPLRVPGVRIPLPPPFSVFDMTSGHQVPASNNEGDFLSAIKEDQRRAQPSPTIVVYCDAHLGVKMVRAESWSPTVELVSIFSDGTRAARNSIPLTSQVNY
jgi:hypothetical protein